MVLFVQVTDNIIFLENIFTKDRKGIQKGGIIMSASKDKDLITAL